MTETTTLDPRVALATAMEATIPVLTKATQADGNLPTPCDAFTLRDLMAHVMGVGLRSVALGNGLPAATAPSELTPEDDDWLGTWQSLIDQTAAAWPQLDPDGQSVVPWATIPTSQAAAIYTSEVLVHTWDMAVSIGEPFAPDDALVAMSLEAMHQQLPDTDRGAMYAEIAKMLPPEVPWNDPFGEAAPTSTDATPIEQLVALAGRSPNWTPPAN